MKIMLSAGETSGDVYGALLISDIKRISPDVYFFGMGGEKLREAGVDVRFDISPRGTVGIIEALPNLISIYSVFLKMKRLLLSEKPDALILIDSQGFNVPLAEYAKKLGIKTIYYIAPQEWLWGTPRGVKKIAKTIDLIIAIFEKEYLTYKNARANVVYFGHPLLDVVTSNASCVAGRICLCPGSRAQEIKNVFPIILQAAKIMGGSLRNFSFVILCASEWLRPNIEKTMKRFSFEAKILSGPKYDILASSDLIIATSGTINMEASILGTPNIMVYKLDPLTCWIGKNILKIGDKLKYFSMPNILLDKKLIPEFIQDNARPEKIATAAIKMLEDKRRLDNAELLKKLGTSPVTCKVAGTILALTRALKSFMPSPQRHRR